jgi:hypothetical protein
LKDNNNENKVNLRNDRGEWSPIYLPMDRGFEAKYMHQYLVKFKKQTTQEKVYLLLEYPAGWFGFFYHSIV